MPRTFIISLFLLSAFTLKSQVPDFCLTKEEYRLYTMVNEARTRIRESLESAKRRLIEAERSAVRHGEEAVTATEDHIKRNPWQSVGIAAGVGLVIGVLLARR